MGDSCESAPSNELRIDLQSMSRFDLLGALAPFRVKSFRFQWPADLLTSLAFEMETLILGWYVLVETESVLWLTAFGALQFLGSLIAPLIGVVADHVGRRAVLCTTRALFMTLAALLMTLGLADALSPAIVLGIALVFGLARPSDSVMRNALIADTVPSGILINAIGLARMTMDSARVAGALAGAGLFALLGFGPAYIVVTGFYAVALTLTLGVARPSRQFDSESDSESAAAFAPWQELKAGLAFVWQTPTVLAFLCLAALLNITVFPIVFGLLPYVAREVYGLDQIGLGHLVAAFASGALVGALIMAVTGGAKRPGRYVLVGMLVWYVLILVFAQQESKLPGVAMLALIGMTQGTVMITMAVILLRATPAQFRGRVMGVRMLAVYGLPTGLMGYGVLIGWIGFSTAVSLSAVIGLLMVGAIGFRWWAVIWGQGMGESVR